MKKLTTHALVAAALVLGFLVARPVRAAEAFIVVPPDGSLVNNARTLVSNACSKCHGVTGNGISISPLFPILAAQQETYIEQQLKKLRQRDRSDPHARAFMWGISRGLTDEQIENVAHYFSTQPAATSSAPRDPALAQKGKEIYENPLQLESGAVNCANCHGLHGEGKSKQAIPRLAGQHPDYLNLQVHYYRWMQRNSAIMNQVSAALTEDQIDAVTTYASSLSP
jgi:cbb3-type cytochrome c oxidase subunit III